MYVHSVNSVRLSRWYAFLVSLIVVDFVADAFVADDFVVAILSCGFCR